MRAFPRPLGVAALVLAGLAPWGRAQEPTSAQEPPPAAQPAPELQEPRTEEPAPEVPVPPVSQTIRLSLEEARGVALDNDLRLAISAETADVARFQYAGSWGAFDPVATAAASVTDSEFQAQSTLSGATVLEENTINFSAGLFFPLITGGSFDVTFDTTNTETNNQFQLINPSTTDVLALSFRQPLLRGAGVRYATSLQREAELVWRQQTESYRVERQQLLLDVEQAYWELVASIEQLAVAEETLQLGRRQLEQNRRRLDAGVGTEVEVLQADANVARQIEQRLLRQVLVLEAADRLKGILWPGIDPKIWNAEIVPTTPLPDVQTRSLPTWEAALVVALEARPDLRRQRLEIDASEVRLARAASERKPLLDLLLSSRARGFSGDSSDAFESAVEFEFPSNTAQLSFSFPIGNRTASNAQRAARARLRSAHLDYDRIESFAASEVRATVRRVLYLAEAVRAGAKSAELARRQLEAEQARYDEGLSTNFQVLEFQQQLSEALFTETRARADFAKTLAEFLRAQGLLGEAVP